MVFLGSYFKLIKAGTINSTSLRQSSVEVLWYWKERYIVSKILKRE